MSDLPCKECGGQCCHMPAMTKREFKRIKSVHGLPHDAVVFKTGFGVVIHRENGECPYLVDGSCSVYALRPSTCRKYGVIEELPCQYLHPEKTKQAVDEKLAKYGIKL